MSGLANPGGLLGPGRRRPVGAVVRAMPYGQPALEQLARDLAGKVKLVKVNVDTSPQISQRFAVQAIPTLLVLRHGQVAPSRRAPSPWLPCRWVRTVGVPSGRTPSPQRSRPWLASGPGGWRQRDIAGWAQRPHRARSPRYERVFGRECDGV
jgi:hypothetical protein